MLKIKFDITDIGQTKHVLGMTIDYRASPIVISQPSYMHDKLTEFNFKQSRTNSTPDEVQSHNHKNEASHTLNARGHTVYRNIVGSHMYASLSTRPDMTHAVIVLSMSNSKPTQACL